jgi:hypothetical protein
VPAIRDEESLIFFNGPIEATSTRHKFSEILPEKNPSHARWTVRAGAQFYPDGTPLRERPVPLSRTAVVVSSAESQKMTIELPGFHCAGAGTAVLTITAFGVLLSYWGPRQTAPVQRAITHV